MKKRIKRCVWDIQQQPVIMPDFDYRYDVIAEQRRGRGENPECEYFSQIVVRMTKSKIATILAEMGDLEL